MSDAAARSGLGSCDSSGDARADSEAAGAARGAPRRRGGRLGGALADGARGEAGCEHTSADKGAPSDQPRAAASAPPPEPPASGTEEEVLAHFGALVQHVLDALQLGQARSVPSGLGLGTGGLTRRAPQPEAPGAPPAAAPLGAREAVAAALAAARWNAAAVIADACADPAAWRAQHGLAAATPSGIQQPGEEPGPAVPTEGPACALCGEVDMEAGPAAALTCGHALCADCARETACNQSELRPCLAAACDVPRGRVVCPAGDCEGFMPRECADAFRTTALRAAVERPLRLAPLAGGPYVRCCACPRLLHRRRAAGDAPPAAGLRCGCGARTCAARGGADECAGRAHAPLSCAAAREFEQIADAWRPVLDAARAEGARLAAAAPAAAAPAPWARPDDELDTDDEEMEMAGMLFDAAGRDRGDLAVVARGAMQRLRILRALGDHPARRGGGARVGLNAVAAAVLLGRGPAESDSFLAAVPAGVSAALAAADAACAPLLRGPEARLRTLLQAALRAATSAQEAVQRAIDTAEAAAEAARSAAALPGGAAATEHATRAAVTASGDAAACAASARASAAAAAEAAARLGAPGAPDAEAVAAAAAVAAVADTAAELANVARGHAATAADLHRSAEAAQAAAAGDLDDAARTAALIDGSTRPCPGCGIPVQKQEGSCNSMEPCTKCKRTFCWSCLGPAHEHSYGPCSLAGNRAAVQAAIAAARPEANAAAQAATMAAMDISVASLRRGAPPPRAATIADAELVPEEEAELAVLSIAAAALRACSAAGDAEATAAQLRMVRALLAEVARAAAGAAARPPEGALDMDLEHEWIRAHMRLRRRRRDRDRARRVRHRAPDAAEAFGLAPAPVVDAEAAPLRAAAERAATALAAAYDAMPGAAYPNGVRDFPAAAAAWAHLHEARRREAAALAAAAEPPAAVARAADAADAWRAGALALAAAEAATSRACVAQLFLALRLPTAAGEAPPPPPPQAPELAAVRDAGLRLSRRLALSMVGHPAWPPAREAEPEQAEAGGRAQQPRIEAMERSIDGVRADVAAVLALADGLAPPW